MGRTIAQEMKHWLAQRRRVDQRYPGTTRLPAVRGRLPRARQVRVAVLTVASTWARSRRSSPTTAARASMNSNRPLTPVTAGGGQAFATIC